MKLITVWINEYTYTNIKMDNELILNVLFWIKKTIEIYFK